MYQQAVQEAATICPRPGLQRKCAGEALSQASRAGPNHPIRAIQAATHRPDVGLYATDRRQTDVRRASSLNAPLGGGIIIEGSVH